jgi:hypothetical protein
VDDKEIMELKLTTHFSLVTRLRINGAIPLLSIRIYGLHSYYIYPAIPNDKPLSCLVDKRGHSTEDKVI